MENFILTPISQSCFFSVVIPVRDEVGHLIKTLEAFAKQVDSQNRPLDSDTFELIVLANNCRDQSAQVARDWKKQNPKIKIHIAEISLAQKFANIGFVRRLLMNEAYRRLIANNSGGGIIATTDGDTRVAPDWIAATIAEIRRGADAVGGRILMEDEELARMDERALYFYLRDEEYRLLASEFECYLDKLPHDAFPRHHQHFNGSFAVTTEAFKRAGGIPDVPFLEDVAFYHALLRVDAKFRHSSAVKVFTSSRHYGRSTVGLSFQLNEWKKLGAKGANFLVEPADAIARKVRARKVLREFWLAAKTNEFPRVKAVAALAENLSVPRKFIFNKLKKPQPFGSLLEKVYGRQNESGRWHRRNPPVAVETAIADLKAKLKILREENHLFKAKAG